MKDRLREARKKLGLSQEAFGEAIGISNTAISKLEKGENKVSEQVIKAVCREFHINYDWLRYGTGAMFDHLPEGLVDELAQEYTLDETDQRLILNYLRLSESERSVIKRFLQGLLN